MALKFDDGLFQLVHSDEQNPKDDRHQFSMPAMNPKSVMVHFKWSILMSKTLKMIKINLLCPL